MGREEETDQKVETEASQAGDTETKGSEAKTPETKQSEYDKHQQALDQERANSAKARQRALEAEQRNDELAEQLEQIKTEHAEMREKLKGELTKEEYANLVNLDPDTTDVPEMVEAFKKLGKELVDTKAKLKQYDDYIAQDTQQKRSAAQQQAHKETCERIYAMCDDEFGAEYRNEAIDESNRMVAEGEEKPPTDPIGGIALMRKAYKAVKTRHAQDKKPAPDKETIPTDTGLRTASPLELIDSEALTTGSLGDVRKDMAKKMKAGQWKRPFALSPPS